MTSLKRKLFWIKFWFIAIAGFFTVNWFYHAYYKPSEIIGLLDGNFYKEPRETWRAHAEAFKENSTNIITPEFLAALAQTETNGNAIARTYWKWSFSTNPFKIFAPASSAAGLLQITDGTFKKLKKYCIRNGRVTQEGCRQNRFYNRLIPSHSLEMTSAYLHLTVEELLGRSSRKVSLEEKQRLAALIHLCGEKKAEVYLKNQMQFGTRERCGAHDPRRYLHKLITYRKIFSRLRTDENLSRN